MQNADNELKINNFKLSLTMIKKAIFEEYVAPELEVISTIVEAGFEISSGIADAEEDNYGDF